MSLASSTINGQPNPQGLYDRCRLLVWGYQGRTDIQQAFLGTQGHLLLTSVQENKGVYAAGYTAFQLDNQLLFCILGTQSVQEFLGHVVGAFTPRFVQGGVKVNSWFYDTATEIHAAWISYIGQLPPGGSIEIWGHSYGAAVAGMLGWLLKADFPSRRINVVTYGSPRAAGPGWSGPSPDSWLRVRNQLDPVVVVPPEAMGSSLPFADTAYALLTGRLNTWTHYGSGVLLPLGGKPLQTDYSDFFEDTSTWVDLQFPRVSAHATPSYLAALAASQGAAASDAVWGSPSITGVDNPTAGYVTIPTGPLAPSLYNDLNMAYYGIVDGPITSTTIGEMQGTSLRVGDVRQLPDNMSDFQGGSTMANPSSWTKVTMCINNGSYGRLESHVLNVSLSNKSQLFPLVLTLCQIRALLLGCGPGPAFNNTKSLGAPQIEFVKLTDAVNPKVGQVVPVGQYNFFGPFNNLFGQQPADTFFSDLSLRILGTQSAYTDGTTEPPPAIVRPSTLQLSGNPDVCIAAGAYNGTAVNVANGVSHIQGIKNYIAFLTNASNPAWGFMGLSSNEDKYQIASWAEPTPGVYTFTAPGNDWATGDRVVVTSANPVFNKIWRITVNAGVATLQNPPVSGHALPSGGFAQLVQNSDQSNAKSFWKYTGVQVDFNSNPIIKVTKKNPGRQFLGVSFRSKRRRER